MGTVGDSFEIERFNCSPAHHHDFSLPQCMKERKHDDYTAVVSYSVMCQVKPLLSAYITKLM